MTGQQMGSVMEFVYMFLGLALGWVASATFAVARQHTAREDHLQDAYRAGVKAGRGEN